MLNEINKLISIVSESLETDDIHKKLYLDEPDDIIKMLKSCSVALNSGVELYRGISSEAGDRYGDIAYINPGINSHLRMPLAANREMMYLYSTLPIFKGWPNRYKSLFFSNDPYQAEQFGDYVYIVLPFNGVKLARVAHDFNDPESPLCDAIQVSKNFYKNIAKTIIADTKTTENERKILSEIPHKCSHIFSGIKMILKYYRGTSVDLYWMLLNDKILNSYGSASQLIKALKRYTLNMRKSETIDIDNILSSLLKTLNKMLVMSDWYNLVDVSEVYSTQFTYEYFTDGPCLLIYEETYEDREFIKLIQSSLR